MDQCLTSATWKIDFKQAGRAIFCFLELGFPGWRPYPAIQVHQAGTKSLIPSWESCQFSQEIGDHIQFVMVWPIVQALIRIFVILGKLSQKLHFHWFLSVSKCLTSILQSKNASYLRLCIRVRRPPYFGPLNCMLIMVSWVGAAVMLSLQFCWRLFDTCVTSLKPFLHMAFFVKFSPKFVEVSKVLSSDRSFFCFGKKSCSKVSFYSRAYVCFYSLVHKDCF